MDRKINFNIIAITSILFGALGTCYLSNFYILGKIAGTTVTNITNPFLGYIFQALGMFAYGYLYKNNPPPHAKFNKSRTSIFVIIIDLILTLIIQLSRNIAILIVASIVLNFFVGVSFEIYLLLLTTKIDKNLRGTYFGISYAIGSVFTFIASYYKGGEFVESPKMAIVYIIVFSIACILLSKEKSVEFKEPTAIDKQSIKYSRILFIAIALLTIVMSLGDGIYNFGRWASEADFRIVRVFYGIGLIIAGIINDKSRRIGAIIAYSCLSYYLISTFLLDNLLSSSAMMSISYFLMAFIAVYRYVSVADLTDEHPQYVSYCGLGLMISRVAEGCTVFFMFICPLSLTPHMIITIILYTPLILLAVILDGLRYRTVNQTNDMKLASFSENYSLTSREQEIYQLILNNKTDDEIAGILYISKPTVRFHISNILKKTNTNSRTQAKRLFDK